MEKKGRVVSGVWGCWGLGGGVGHGACVCWRERGNVVGSAYVCWRERGSVVRVWVGGQGERGREDAGVFAEHRPAVCRASVLGRLWLRVCGIPLGFSAS